MLFVLFLLAAAATIVAILLLLSSQCASEEEDSKYVHEFRPERYGPLKRLLSSEDLLFMSDQGLPFHSAVVYRIRRFRVTWAYLRALAGDFGRVHRSARHLLVWSDADLPELSTALVRAQVGFVCMCALARAEAIVMMFGVSLGLRHAERALGTISSLSRALAAAQQQSAAALSRA